MTPIVVIAGPTAAGKTAVALRWANVLRGELVGADSVQVYRGFDIGSAKPTPEELEGVRHHLIDVIEPDQNIDAMHFAKLADVAIADIASRGKLPIVVGGTGLWIRALLRGLVDLPKVDSVLRARLTERFGIDAMGMYKELTQFDPLTAAKVHPNDVIRVVRAFEVYEQTGEPLGELRRVHALGMPRYPHLFVVLASPVSELDSRIEERIDVMLSNGWQAEVETLIARFGSNIRALRSVGYKQLLDATTQPVSPTDLRAQIRKATRQYAKRQRTWFNGEAGVHWRPSRRVAESSDTVTKLGALLSREIES